MNFKYFFILGVVFGLTLPPHFSRAGSDLEQLKNDVAILKNSTQNSNTKLADALNQLITIQQEFGSMKGVLESGGHFFEEQTQTLRAYDQRIQAMEDKVSTLMNLLKEIKENGVGSKLATASEAQTKEFQKLLDLVNASDYNKAKAGFQAFLQKNPKNALADNAQYWLAECHYSLNDYKVAIGEYQNLIQKYPKSPKVKQALFKQGLSFLGLNMPAEAKPFFEKVISDYPNTSEAAQASAKIKEIDKTTTAESFPTNSPSPAPQNSSPALISPSLPTPQTGGKYD